jgi:hypothetical protein
MTRFKIKYKSKKIPNPKNAITTIKETDIENTLDSNIATTQDKDIEVL